MLRQSSVHDFGQQTTALFQAERFNNHIVILTIAEIAECEAGFRGVCGADAGEIEIKPVLAVQGDFGIIEQFRHETVHMRHLCTLLAGIEAGAGRFKARTVIGACSKFRNCIGSAGIKPDPGITDRLIIASNKPCAITLTRDGNGGGASAQARDFF
ncbi:hypothetical protein D3C80_586550 [compost metagenome]